ncbi:T9SS type A sorting domain-containing protein [Adhaeribacter radiodurans]|uniref:T9SS type A sorting domain-containing protein n=1 Tax=Adhaeribacter radiodurans TaxID=2745197 RepID=A0A7L7LCG2_9BACT|nr:T9SS type A sorting domain-containing protein [Adhaeribacter radiodurans]QMU30463.1 T9SS type A sorting domain-containing protein [Adhaeribacter radiodurans]
MKNILSLLFLMLPFLLQAQGVVNNGGKIVVGTGSFFTISGNNSHLTNNTTATTDGTFDNNGTIRLQGNLINNAGNNLFINPNGVGEIVFTGITGQAVMGPSPTKFERFTVNNATGLTLQQNVITEVLTLSTGPLYLNAQTLSVTSNAPAAITRTNGYIVSEQTNNSGRVNWNIGNSTGTHIFPFGTASGSYIPFVLNLTSGNIGNVAVATYATGNNNQPYPTTPDLVTNVNGWDGKDNSANTVDRFWQIDKDGPSGTATLTFTASPEEVGEITMLQAQRWNAAQAIWEFPLPGQSNTATSATVPDVTAFSPWTLSGNNSPLPIQLLTFTATLNNAQVNLHWKTVSETNTDFFTVEKTRDLKNYQTVATVKAAGTSKQIITYNAQDAQPYSGVSYYRLKQTDLNKKTYYSEVVAINLIENSVFAVRVFPNPTEGTINIFIGGDDDKEYTLLLTDMVGQRYYNKKVKTELTYHTFLINQNRYLPSGVYLLTVAGAGHFYSRKVVIQ